MRSRHATLICIALLAGLALGGCGTGDASGVLAVITVDAITNPLSSAGGTPFTINGTNFLSIFGVNVTVRFTASTGTPFNGGTSNTADVPGTITSLTTVTGNAPAAGAATFTAFVTVILPTTASGTSTTPIAQFIGGPPMAIDDNYNAIGNVTLNVPAGTGLISNDNPPNVFNVTNAAALTTTTMGGDLTVNPDGSFTYDPPVGFEGMDTFMYEVGGGVSMATVTITVAEVVWFVDSMAGAGGDGRQIAPFNNLGDFIAVNGGGGMTDPKADDYIFLFNRGAPYTGQLVLEDGQQLIGQGVDLMVGATTVVPGIGMNSALQAAAGDTVTLAMNNTVRGLNIGSTNGGCVIGTSGGSFDMDTCTLNAIDGEALFLTNAAGGTVSVDGVNVNNTTDDGIFLQNNTSSFSFSDVNITTTTGRGLYADMNSAVTVTGTMNTIDTTMGEALTVSNTTIGAAGLTFRDISADGAPYGILLSNTGTVGGLTVTGDGTGVANGSGGTIQNTTADGISLTNCANASFHQLNVTNTVGHGVLANTVTNFSFQDADVTLAGAMDDRHSIAFTDLFGTSLIQNVTFDDINEDAIELFNTMADDATTDTLSVRGCQFLNHTAAGFAENGVDVQATGTSHVTVNIDMMCVFTLNMEGAVGIIASSVDTSTLVMTIDLCNFNALNAFGSGTIQVGGAGMSTATFNITNNTINDGGFNGISCNCDDTSNTSATITGNMIDQVTGNMGFGISMRQDTNGTLTALLNGNTIQDTGFDAIRLNARDGTMAGIGVFNATVTGNTISTAPSTFGPGISATVDDTNTMCLNISGNTAMGTGTASPLDDDIYIDADDTSTLNITQASAMDISTVNNAATVGIGTGTGTTNYSQPACPTP